MYGLNTYDYGARQHDPILARWDRIDPLCEKYYGVSPYAYCGNNPVNRVDPDGRIWDTILDVAFVAYDLVDAGIQYCKTGKVSNETKAALGADVLAAVIPGVTGAGLAVRGGKAVAKPTEIAKTAERVQQTTKNGAKMNKLRQKAEIGQEAHRQIEKELTEKIPGTKTEVKINPAYQPTSPSFIGPKKK